MKIKTIYHKIIFLTILIFISACNQDNKNKKDKVISYSEEDDGPYLMSANTVDVDFSFWATFL